jgi:hypothetical protein
MNYTYKDCTNIAAGTYIFYSNNISSAQGCFEGKLNNRRFNIHVPNNSKTLNTFIINNNLSLVNNNITWTKSGRNYYNTVYNIYIYANTSLV